MGKTQSKKFLTDSNTRWETTGPGVRCRILGYDNDVMMVVVEFVTGAEGSPHQHPHSQVTYVESGRFEVTIDGEKQVLGPGDGFHTAPGETHGVVCLEAGSLINVFSPHQEDAFLRVISVALGTEFRNTISFSRHCEEQKRCGNLYGNTRKKKSLHFPQPRRRA